MTDDRRAVLEALAYGSDPRIAPGDRMRALELLREHEPQHERRDLSDAPTKNWTNGSTPSWPPTSRSSWPPN
jgi:hypothetical protein